MHTDFMIGGPGSRGRRPRGGRGRRCRCCATTPGSWPERLAHLAPEVARKRGDLAAHGRRGRLRQRCERLQRDVEDAALSRHGARYRPRVRARRSWERSQPAVRETSGMNSGGTGRSVLGCSTYPSNPGSSFTPAGLVARLDTSAASAKRFGSTSTSSSPRSRKICVTAREEPSQSLMSAEPAGP